mmetsp:Transcript_16161/g.41505  ORF Transcript_16161/g.41505 Transcript_16161/m.41505 type:complete len:247 (-) Transcript_16161:311-1051(-)
MSLHTEQVPEAAGQVRSAAAAPSSSSLHAVLSARLLALQYPNHRLFDLDSYGERRALVCWLENMKIRLYPIENRAGLSNFDEQWDERFRTYLTELRCPHRLDNSDSKSIARVFLWLLGQALRLEFHDLAPQYDPVLAAKHSFLVDEEFQAALRTLCSILEISHTSNQAELLQTVSRTIVRDYSPAVLERANAMETTDDRLDLKDFPSGFDCGGTRQSVLWFHFMPDLVVCFVVGSVRGDRESLRPS